MFSVIIPAYNAELYIYKSVNSVLNQTIGDFEIVVIDDVSTDNTKQIVDMFHDKRIRYIYQSNAGVSAARNTGIKNAVGEYICFLDADDLWKPNHLEEIDFLIKKYPETDVYITGHEIILHDGTVIKKNCPGVIDTLQCDNPFKHIWENGYFFNTNSIACKANVFDLVGFFEVGVKNSEDDDMWYRLFSYYSVGISNTITTTYVRENSRATESRVFVENWVFLDRVKEIMNSPLVSDEKKVYLNRLLEQRKISVVRYYILKGEKKIAIKHMRLINKKMIKRKKYIETLIALIIPSCLSLYYVKRRDIQYYGA